MSVQDKVKEIETLMDKLLEIEDPLKEEGYNKVFEIKNKLENVKLGLWDIASHKQRELIENVRDNFSQFERSLFSINIARQGIVQSLKIYRKK